VSTGWLLFLPAQFSLSKQNFTILLAVISCMSLLPPVSITSVLDIKLDYLFLFVFFVYALAKIPIHRVMTLVSLMIMLGSILFLFHEVSQTQLLWRSLEFQWFTILLSIGEAVVSANLIIEQFSLIFGGLWITQCLLYYLYQDRLSPIAFPGLGALDTFWVTVVILIVIKGLQLQIPTLWKNRRIVYWIKKR
jgi:hypothetical protein